MDKRSDTIAAISTPQGRSGIGIVRISGAKALEIINPFISSPYALEKLTTAKHRKLIHAKVLNQDQETIDEILLAYLPKEKSFTGETTVELNCHGGRAVLTETLNLAIQSGARLAEPGEFTRRAFENGRLDLVQAEAVNELIQARTKSAIKAAWRLMEGGLTRRCTELREQLIRVLSEIQVKTDFDHEQMSAPHSDWYPALENSLDIIKNMLKTAEKSKYLVHGCWVVLSGPPNAGKSSIFNSILNIERSIVTDIPGTTRDHISEQIELDGMEVRLTDTAGIRQSKDKIETLSIGKSEQQRLSADIVIYVLDQSLALSANEQKEAQSILDHSGFVVFNKCDLKMHHTVETFIRKKKERRILFVSALNHTGIEDFLDLLSEAINEKALYSENTIIMNLRQIQALEKSKQTVSSALEILSKGGEMDLAMFEIQEGIKALQEIIGEVSTDEVLNSIFSRFCIGK